MEEYSEEKQHESETDSNETPQGADFPQAPPRFPSNRWAAGVIVLVLILAGAGWAFSYGHRQSAMVGQLASQQNQLNATVSKVQDQLAVIAAQLKDLSAAQAAAQTAPAPPAASAPAATSAPKRATVSRAAPQPDRLKQIQDRIDLQQKELSATEAEVAKNRSDLEGSLNSTRDELNGSIAKTHDELVALEKRGERNYFEFDLTKEKQYQRSGPVMLSLRKADPKHERLDLAMIVNDNELTKKNVNLYEPIWIYDSNDAPVQVVINRIDKNRVHGYVSAPKYSAPATAENSALTLSPSPAAGSNPSPSPSPSPAPATDTPGASQ